VLGGIIYRWLLLFQEFDFEVVVKHGRLNAGPDHLSRITNGEEPSSLEDNFPNAQLFLVHIVDEYFYDIIEFFIQDFSQRNITLRRRRIWWLELHITNLL